MPKLKKVNFFTLYNKKWAIVLKNKVKYIDFTNVLYYVIKLKKLVKN